MTGPTNPLSLQKHLAAVLLAPLAVIRTFRDFIGGAEDEAASGGAHNK